MRVLLAVGDTDLRLSLELLLSEEPGVVIAGSVIDTRGLLALVKSSCPDLVLLDWELPGGSSEAVLGEIQTLDCQPKCIVLGRRHSSQDPAERAGADVYITKGDPPEQLLVAIRALNA
jgi:DNA-binding NarL/FixJ family response regulator